MPVWHSGAIPIIAARRYSAGKVVDPGLPLDGAPRERMAAHAFDWIGLADPTEAEMELVSRQFGLHPLAVEDALTPTQMPKVEAYGPQLFIVARTAAMTNGENIDYGQTALFLGRDFIVTVRFGSTWAKVRTVKPRATSVANFLKSIPLKPNQGAFDENPR